MYRCDSTPVAAHRGPRRRHRHRLRRGRRLHPSTGVLPSRGRGADPSHRADIPAPVRRLAQARPEERFPDLIDPLREVHVPPAWPNAGAFLRAAPDWFALDRTAGQATALYVACERDTLRAQLTGWLKRPGIPVLVVCGFGSRTSRSCASVRPGTSGRPYCSTSETSTPQGPTSNGTGSPARPAGAEGTRPAHARPGPRVRAARGRGEGRRPPLGGVRPTVRARRRPAGAVGDRGPRPGRAPAPGPRRCRSPRRSGPARRPHRGGGTPTGPSQSVHCGVACRAPARWLTAGR